MKIRYSQITIIPGNPLKNYNTCAEAALRAKAEGVDVLLLPETAIPGYMNGDKFEEQDFIEDCEFYAAKLAALADDEFSLIFGSVMFFETLSGKLKVGPDGRRAKLNVAYVATSKGVEYRVKTLLPNYREFEEPRHFRDNLWVKNNLQTWNMFRPFNIGGVSFGVTICEDGWDSDYDIKPMDRAAENGAQIIVNLSCSPFTTGKNLSRDRRFGAHAFDLHLPVIYVNAVGLQNNGKTVFAFDGSSAAWNKGGRLITQSPMYEDNDKDFIFADGDLTPVISEPIQQRSDIEDIHDTLVYGIRMYMKQNGLNRVVIGASGGVDSCLAAALYVEAIGSDNVILVNMPTKYNSKTTIGIAEKLASNLGCYYTSVPIGESANLTAGQINGLKAENKSGSSVVLQLSSFNMENVQARDRSARVLAAIASAWGAVFTNNGNKTESTVGYATLYGDVAGFFAVLGDLWKHVVYQLGKYINEQSRSGELIPAEVFTIIPSAELSAEQSLDAGKGDPLIYPYHDRLFASWQEWWNHASLYDILKHYLDGDLADFLNRGTKTELDESLIKKHFPDVASFVADLERWYRLFKGMGLAKRIQAPPVMAVTRRAYGFDYRESVTELYLGRKYEQLKSETLS